MNRKRIERELRGHPLPGEEEAAERSWEVVRAALAERERSPSRTAARLPVRLAVAVAALGALTMALTPAGATVREWMQDAVGGGEAPARPALTHVPSGGRLLVDSPSGQWVVGEDGARRSLGEFGSSTWSPSGVYVAVAGEDQLVAVEPDGDPRWSISAPGRVADQAWAPGCCRIAYRSGRSLRVIDGAGEGDRQLVGRVASLAPVWMPVPYDDESRNVLAYADPAGRVIAIDVDTGLELASIPTRERPVSLEWLDRNRILAVGRGGLEILRVDDASTRKLPALGGGRIEGASVSRESGRIAILSRSGSGGSARSSLVLRDLDPLGGEGRRIFSGSGHYEGPTFSPDGSRILLGWRDTDQWLFVSPDPSIDPVAVGDIARQFDPGSRGSSRLPEVEGWCCG